jgi:hypothetical protein
VTRPSISSINASSSRSNHEFFLEPAIDGLALAVDLFWPIQDLANGVDSRASQEVSPLVAPGWLHEASLEHIHEALRCSA